MCSRVTLPRSFSVFRKENAINLSGNCVSARRSSLFQCGFLFASRAWTTDLHVVYVCECLFALLPRSAMSLSSRAWFHLWNALKSVSGAWKRAETVSVLASGGAWKFDWVRRKRALNFLIVYYKTLMVFAATLAFLQTCSFLSEIESRSGASHTPIIIAKDWSFRKSQFALGLTNWLIIQLPEPWLAS